MTVAIVRDRAREGRYRLACAELSSVTLSLAQTVTGGWKRSAEGRLYGSLLNLIDDVMAEHGVTDYKIEGMVEAIRETVGGGR